MHASASCPFVLLPYKINIQTDVLLLNQMCPSISTKSNFILFVQLFKMTSFIKSVFGEDAPVWYNGSYCCLCLQCSFSPDRLLLVLTKIKKLWSLQILKRAEVLKSVCWEETFFIFQFFLWSSSTLFEVPLLWSTCRRKHRNRKCFSEDSSSHSRYRST